MAEVENLVVDILRRLQGDMADLKQGQCSIREELIGEGSAGRSILKPVTTGFSSRQGTTLPFGRPRPSCVGSKPALLAPQMTPRLVARLAGFLTETRPALRLPGTTRLARFALLHVSQRVQG